jgi:hypothetical protein
LERVYALADSGIAVGLSPMAPAQKKLAPPPQQVQAPTSQPPRQVIVEPVRVFDPFFDYPYRYAYEPDYMAANFGYVKTKTDHKDASVYVDGSFADRIEKAKKFALRHGTHDIELRDSVSRESGGTCWQDNRAEGWINENT